MARSALVLGGGGVTGVAWELGVLAGLAEAGLDLTVADVVVGTSAGSVVAAQVTTGGGLAALYERQLAGYGSDVLARMSVATMVSLAWAVRGTRSPQQGLARAGAYARKAKTVPEAERRAIVAGRLPVRDWPARTLLITAVDADTGEFVVFSRDSGVDLVDAVAASCAVPGVWPPVTIGERRYIDGGMRAPANVDVAVGSDPVVVLAPLTASWRREWTVARQVAALPAGTRTLVISPDRTAAEAIGRNPLDPARRGPAARAGRRQAEALVRTVAAIWSPST